MYHLLLQSALQPLVGFGLLYDFVPQSSIFTLLSPIELCIILIHIHSIVEHCEKYFMDILY